MKRLNYFFAPIILLLSAALFSSEVAAQIAFVKTIGTIAPSNNGTSTTITVPAAGVAVGNSVILTLAMNPSSGTVSCSDTRGNAYTSNRDVTNGSGTSGVRTVVLSAHNIIALTSGNTISCTHPSVTARALSANEFSGLVASSTTDQVQSATGTSTAPSSGSTPATTQASELLIGGIGVEGPSTETFTAGASYTTIGRAGTSGGNAANNITINPEYRIVSATGAYAATGTLSSSRLWAAAIVTYKAASPVATKLVITSINGGSNPTAGVGFPVVVQSQNASGSPTNVVSATGVSLSLKTGTGTLGGTLTGTIAAGTNQVTITGVTYTKAESGVVITATRTSGDTLTAGDSAPFTVNPGAATKVAFSTQPGSSTAGSPLVGPPTVVVQDSLGNTVTSSTASITVAIGTNPGSGTLSGTATKNASSGVASFSDLSINKAGTGYTLTASSTGLTSATSSAFNITAAAASKVVFTTQPANATAGSAIGGPPTVTVQDSFGNTVTSSTASITMAIGTNPGGGTLSGTTPKNAASGVASFTDLSINLAGTGYTLTASATGLTSATSSTFNITAAAASKVVFTTQPASATAGSAIGGPPTVTVQDSFGNTVTSSTASITVAIGTNPGGGTLSGTTPKNATAGVASFSDLSIDKAGTGYTLTASATGLTSATSSAFNITAAAASKVVFSAQPGNATAGTAIPGPPTVTVQDSFGNTVTSSTASITVAIGTNPGSGTLSGTTTKNASGGIASFSDLSIDKVGTGYTLTASSTGLTAATSNGFNISAGAAAALTFSTQPGNANTGSSIPGPPTISMRDSFGNTVTTSTASITVAIGTNPGGGILSGTTNKNATSGVASFSDLSINNAGVGYTLTASATGLTGTTSSAFTINAGTATKLVITTQPGTAIAGSAIPGPLTVAIQDDFGNTITSSTAAITISLGNNPTGAILSGTLTKNASAGVASFSDLSVDKASGGYTLVASSGGLGLVSYWKFDDSPPSTTAADSSGNNNTGTLVGSPTWTTGIIGQALSFNGANTYVEIPNSTSLNPTSQITISAWVKRDSSAPQQQFQRIVDKHTAGHGPYQMYFYFANYHLGGYIQGASSTSGDIDSGWLVPADVWAHLAITYDGSNIRFYGNGVLQNTTAYAGGLYNSTENVTIGAAVNHGSGFMHGSIDDVRIYDRAISSSEVSQLYGCSGGSSCGLTSATSTAFTVNPGTAANLAFTTQPGNVSAGSPLSGPPTVTVRDSFGNTVTSSTASITVAIGTNPAGGTLSGTTTKNAVSGVASFTDLSINLAGTGYTLTASATGLTGATSSAINIGAAAASKVAFTTQPANATAGSALGGPPTVTVQDSFGNTVTSSTASITVAIGTNPGGGTLSGTTTKNAVLGVAIFNDLSINLAGNGYTLAATSTGLTGATSGAFNITALVPDLVITSISNPPATALLGGSFSVTDTTANNGNGSAAASTTSYRLSLDNVITTGDPLLTGTRSVPSLGAGTNSSGSVSVTIPSNLTPGTYYLGACADDGGVVSESNESNNCLASTSTVVVSAPPPPSTGIVYIYDRLSRLRAVVELASETGIYNYDSVGNVLSIVRQNSSIVTIIEISKNIGPAGTTIAIYGTGFSSTCSQNSVNFNGTAATIISCTATQIVTSVPAGATSGSVNVTAPNGSASSNESFNVTPTSGAPVLVSFSPSIGEPNTSVNITGSGFETTPANNRTRFNIVQSFATTATTTNLATSVPSGATSGHITVSTPLGKSTSTGDFFVPPFLQPASSVEFTGRMNIGGNTTVNITSGNKMGMVVFDGTQGQLVTLNVTGVSFPNPVSLYLQAPDGTSLVAASIGSAGATLPPILLPSTGTYTVSIIPRILTNISGGYGGGDGGPATMAHLDGPSGLTMDAQGNVYFADYYNSRIRKISTSGIVTTVAGDGNPTYGGDGGLATSAQISFPWSVTADNQGNLFIADFNNNRIRKVNSSGTMSTVAGNGTAGFGGDGGLATTAQLNGPSAVAVDGQGNFFITDYNNHRVRKVATNGIITTVAGTGTSGFSGDGGLATIAQINRPAGLTLDAQGNFYIADYNNHRVRKVDVGGVISTVAGTGTAGFSGDGGAASSAQLNHPSGVGLDTQGNLFITEEGNNRVRKVDTLGIITTVAGNGIWGFAGDGGPAINAQLKEPWATIVDASGNLFIGDSRNDRIRKVDTSGIISSIAGTDSIGDGGLAKDAVIDYPTGLATDSQGNIYVADFGLDRIRKIAPNGIITTIAGDGTSGEGGDGGPATSAQINAPWDIALDNQGNVYIADYNNSRIRKVDTNGIITTIAGTGVDGYSGDGGPATSAKLNGPEGVAVDSLGNVYIGDTFNHRVRKIDTSGTITTFAGTGSQGFNGDGIPATSAKLYYPIGLAVDSNNNIYIADENNNRVRKVNTTGIITTVAGNGTFGFGGDNVPATSSSLSFPQGVALDAQGNLYIAEERHRVRKVDTNGVVSTLTGTGEPGYNGNNIVPTLAHVSFPTRVAVDGQGNIYISDSDNFLLRGILAVSTGSLTLTLTTP